MKKILLILLFLSSFSSIYSVENKNILVINSYHPGLEWEDRITNGIKDILIPDNFNITFEYLDAKRNFDEEHFNKLARLYGEKAKSTNFRAIIVCDNVALDFIIKYGPELFPDLPIIFCGMNDFIENAFGDKKNIYGILENVDHQRNLDLSLNLHKDKKKILIINDNTVTGKAIRKELERIIPSYKSKIETEIFSDFSMEELKNKVKNLDPQTIIYLLVVNRDRLGNFISYNDGIKEIVEVSKNPIYGAWDFYLDKGIVGGNIVSGYQQGIEAGILLKDVLNNRYREYSRFFKEGETKYMFDYKELKKFDISISSLPKNSIIINEPETFTYKYNTQILIFSFLIVMLLIIGILFKQRNEKILKNMVLEKTSHLNELNKKLEHLSSIDFLTTLYNRRYFNEQLEKDWNIFKNKKSPLSIIMIDVDHFKKYNDTYGHLPGDLCLQRLAKSFLMTLDPYSATVTRYGGEEFTIILSESLDITKIISKEIIKNVRDLKIPHSSSPLGVVTVSIGVGIGSSSENKTSKDLVKLSDDALYESKNSGRNKYTIKYM